jgi:hypothetical protein
VASKPKLNNSTKEKSIARLSGNSTVVIFLGVAFIFMIVMIFYIYETSVPEAVRICQQAVPGSSQLGLGFSAGSDGAIKIDLGTSQIKNPATSEALAALIECLKIEQKKTVEIVRGVNIPDVEPLGQVADHWKETDDMKLTLLLDAGSNVLQNLRFGPAIGTKASVVGEWCSPRRAGNCVVCNPSWPTDDTKNVEITLRPNPPITLKQMQGRFQQPEAGSLWPLVDANGVRTYYECSASK